LIPGPAGTESLWARTTTVRSGSPDGESAITLFVMRFSEIVCVVMCHAAGAEVCANAAGAVSSKNGNSNGCSRALQPAALSARVSRGTATAPPRDCQARARYQARSIS